MEQNIDLNNPSVNARMPMKHCILMTAYKDAGQINRFISTIPYSWDIYIHLDKKSGISINEIHKRAYAFKKFNIFWGGVEHLDAILFLMRTAYNNAGYDYYHVVTGQDYFASSPQKFDSILGNNQRIYMGYFPLPRKNWWKGGYYILQYKTLSSYVDTRKFIYRIPNKLLYFFQKYLHLQRELPPYPLWGGVSMALFQIKL